MQWDVKHSLLLTTAAEICHSVSMQWTSTETPAVQRVIGLMSGTSADGVDAALVEIRGHGLATQVRVLAHATYPYDAALRAQILAASYPESSSVDLICHLNVALGECFAEAAIAVARTAGVPLNQIDLIGSHGQTIYHIPAASTTPPRHPSTLQIGEPCVIAERTGISTVADFRPRDMAAGGLGPPSHPMDTICSLLIHNVPSSCKTSVVSPMSPSWLSPICPTCWRSIQGPGIC